MHRSTRERRGRRENFVERVLEVIPVVPLDLHVARVHARLGSEMMSAGMGVGEYDLIIAASAVAHDYVLVTHNVTHFEHVPGLEMEEPRL